MQKQTRSLSLSSFEMWCTTLFGMAVLLAGESHLLLQKLGLMDSSAIVKGQVSSKVGNGLQTLDSFRLTAGVVTFLVWALVGLVTLSVVRGIMQASGMIKFESELSSNRYVHPQNFNRDRYWKRVIEDTVLSFVLLAFLAAGVTLYVTCAVPVSLAYTRSFILNVTSSTAVNLLLGLFTIIVSTIVLYCLLKLVAWHHRLSQQ